MPLFTPFSVVVPASRGHRRAWWLALAFSAGLVGCATPMGAALPAAGAAVAVPTAWSQTLPGAPSVAATPADWWTQFQDPQLTAWVEQALSANTTLRSAQAALRQSRAQADVAAAGLSPALGVSASAQRSQVGQGTPGNTFRLGFDASWEPDVFGARRSAAEASEADVATAQATLASTQVSLAAEVAVQYIEWRGLQTRLGLAQNNLGKQLEALQLTEWRVQAGLASSLELAQARAAAEQTRATLPALHNSIIQAQNALSVLTGQAPGRAPVVRMDGASAVAKTDAKAGSEPPVGVPQPPASMALSFPADTLRQRPDVRAAEQKVRAAWARRHQADANRYPNLALSGSLGLNAARLGDLFDMAALTRSVLASVSASLWDGGAARAQVRVQDAVLEQARLAHEAAVLTALQDVENALTALQSNRQRLASLQTAAEAAAHAELLARQRYASGLVDYQTLLDTQRTLISAQSELETTRATWSADHVRLYKALGGGWRPDAAPPATPAASAVSVAAGVAAAPPFLTASPRATVRSAP